MARGVQISAEAEDSFGPRKQSERILAACRRDQELDCSEAGQRQVLLDNDARRRSDRVEGHVGCWQEAVMPVLSLQICDEGMTEPSSAVVRVPVLPIAVLRTQKRAALRAAAGTERFARRSGVASSRKPVNMLSKQ
jgi:hypothetical protein